jgi:CRP/FNR family transcriptional regulator
VNQPVLSTIGGLAVAALLPRQGAQEFARNCAIYGPGLPSDRIYQVRTGHVVINNSLDGGPPQATRILGYNDLFGESALLASRDPRESALTLDSVQVFSWTRTEIEAHVIRDPKLGLELTRYFARCCADFNIRLEAAVFRNTGERLLLSLLQLAESLGVDTGPATRIPPLTHQLLAGYVGTSREIVTAHLTAFRRQGLLKYSRKFIDIDAPQVRKKLQLTAARAARGAS